MTRYPLDEHRQALAKMTREPEKCTCVPRNPRHPDPWMCVTIGEIALWKQRERPPKTARENQQLFAWLWKEFSQDPEAKRISGRAA